MKNIDLDMMGNRVLRRILGPKREEVTEDWRRVNNDELQEVCQTTKTVTVIQSMKINSNWTEHMQHLII
jgi:hypothetical protein